METAEICPVGQSTIGAEAQQCYRRLYHPSAGDSPFTQGCVRRKAVDHRFVAVKVLIHPAVATVNHTIKRTSGICRMSFLKSVLSIRPAFALGTALLLGACASSSDPSANDPIEGFNRGVHAVNQAVDTVVLRPVAYAYREGMPGPFQDRIRDFLNNLKTPVVLANDLLQGDFGRAGTTFERFWINTILGIGGLVDIASSVGIQRHSEDFGQTLATWGVGEGPYLVLPLLGPSNPRDAVGFVVDLAMDPLTWILPATSNQNIGYGRTAADIIDGRSRLITATDDLQKNSQDYYATLRSVYRQRRNAEITNGKTAMPAGMGDEAAYPGQSPTDQ